MAKKKTIKHQPLQPKVVHLPVAEQQAETDELFDLSDPDVFRKAFIASEILNRKY